MSYNIRTTGTNINILNLTQDVEVLIDGSLTINQDLTVLGTTTTIDTNNLLIEDPIFVSGTGNTTDSSDLGMVMTRGVGGNVALLWDESEDQFVLCATTADGSTSGDMVISSYSPLRTGDLQCEVFTSNGIDDNVTETRLRVENSTTHWGQSTAFSGYALSRGITSGSLTIAGGEDGSDGSSVTFIGSTGSPANDIRFRVGLSTVLLYDDSDTEWDFQDNSLTTSSQFISTATTGTSPLAVSSTTLVTNLNADQVDGLDSTDLLLVDGSQALTANWDAGSFDITAEQFHSDIVTGTSPFTVASTTVVSNLNADLLDGFEAAGFPNRNDTTANPAATDDLANYQIGSVWVNTTSDAIFINVDNTDDTAIWKELSTTDIALSEIVQDTTPQLGANLDMNSFGIDFSEILNVTLDTDIAAGDAINISGSAAGELTLGAGGIQRFITINPHINQTGAASYTALHMDVTETSTGSGDKFLVDIQKNGTSQLTLNDSSYLDVNGYVEGTGFVGAELINKIESGKTILSGGLSTTTGASIQLFGTTEATTPRDILFKSDASTELHYDDSESTWDFQSNVIKTSSDVVLLTDARVDNRNTVEYFDDFVMKAFDETNENWILNSGSDDLAVDPAIVIAAGGTAFLDAGDGDGTVAVDGSQLVWAIPVQAGYGGLVFEARVKIEDITGCSVNIGLTDSTVLEEPFSGAADVITSNASDAVCFVYDNGNTTKEWFVAGVDTDTDATGTGASGTAPVNDTYQVLRCVIDADGEGAEFFINKVSVGTLTAAATANNVDLYLTAIIVGDGANAAAVGLTVDYMYVSHIR